MINGNDKRELQKLKYSLNATSRYIDEILSSKNELDINTRYYLHKEILYPLYGFAQGTRRKEMDEQLATSTGEDAIKKCLKGETNFRKKLIHYSPDVEYSFSLFRDGYKFVIPFLCSRTSTNIKIAREKKYINSIFENLILIHQNEITPFDEATVIIISYAPDTAITVDNDNADIHDIINIVKYYLLRTDDRGEYLDVAIKSRIGKQYFTEVYVLPSRDFILPR